MSEENFTEPAEIGEPTQVNEPAEMGEPAKQGGKALPTVLIVVGGIAVVLILICCVVFVMLTILGPQIGNVFSQITYELENPTAAVVPWLGALVPLN